MTELYDKLNINIKYSSENNDLLKEFYLPVLSISNKYDRAVGYFSSSILSEYVSSLSDFYHNNGTMRLIMSPELSAEDLVVIKNTTEFTQDEQYRRFAIKKLLELFKSEQRTHADLFFNLILSGLLEVKIAIVKEGSGVFHEKYGLFYENDGDKIIAINGSNNETYRGIGLNQESFNTFCSWIDGQLPYVKQHKQDFEKYWNNDSSKLKVFNVDKENFNEVFDNVKNINVKEAFVRLKKEQSTNFERTKSEILGLDFIPFSYQKEAALKLIEINKGILKFATGSGKTKTAITYMQMLKKINSKTFFVIVVPDKTLTHQWAKEVLNYNENVLTTFSDNPNWKLDLRRSVSIYNNSTVANEVVITTIQTMFREGKESYFLKEISRLDDFIIISDECHNLSTDLIMSNIPVTPSRRVGLSATPTRDIPSSIEQQMLDYFGGVIAEYSLSDAIKDNKLCRYNYYPIIVQLEDDEKEEYDVLSRSIATLTARVKNNTEDNDARKQLELLNYKRARVVYGAKQKINKLRRLLIDGKIERDYLLIYCGATSYNNEEGQESLTQLNVVNHLLKEMDIVNAQYTSTEGFGERKNALKLFEDGTINTLVAIKCLDEGVDIPLIRNAVILASSNSKREFIQRRGRVLRKSPGKDVVNIYDMVVRDFTNMDTSLNRNETKRIIEFMSDANNADDIYRLNYEYIELVKQKEEESKNER